MGLGKTIQTLALLQYNKEHYISKKTAWQRNRIKPFNRIGYKTYIADYCTGLNLSITGENEIKRFVPGMNVYSYKGNQRKKIDLILSKL